VDHGRRATSEQIVPETLQSLEERRALSATTQMAHTMVPSLGKENGDILYLAPKKA
jgi:hypothetical protein